LNVFHASDLRLTPDGFYIKDQAAWMVQVGAIGVVQLIDHVEIFCIRAAIGYDMWWIKQQIRWGYKFSHEDNFVSRKCAYMNLYCFPTSYCIHVVRLQQVSSSLENGSKWTLLPAAQVLQTRNQRRENKPF
jgi:hypothetical protein